MLLSSEDGDTSTGTWCNEFWGCFFGSCPGGAHPVLPEGFPHFMGVGLGTVSCAAHAPLLLLWVWQGANEDAAGMRGSGAKPNGLVWVPEVAQSWGGRTIFANKCGCISLEP